MSKRATPEPTHRFADPTFILIWFMVCVSRIALPIIIGTVPPMDEIYIRLARELFSGQRSIAIRVSPFYAITMHLLNRLIGNWVVTSWIVYIACSILLALAIYLLAKDMFGAQVARYVLLLVSIHPSFTFAVVGFSHTVVASTAFLALYLYYFWRMINGRGKRFDSILAVGSILISTLIRPETAFYFIFFTIGAILIEFFYIRAHKRPRDSMKIGLMIVMFTAVIIIQYQLIIGRAESKYMNLFTDARYSYETYTHTLSLRAAGVIDNNLAQKLARQAFGDPETLEYSIANAIKANPQEAAKNVIFNLKSLLQIAAHPLFMPFFLYLFIGLGLFSQAWSGAWKQYVFLFAMIMPCLLTILIMHVEVRYLNPIAIPLTILAGLGINSVTGRRRPYVVYTFFVIFGALFVINLLYYSQNPIAV
jgi:hypothetical protein